LALLDATLGPAAVKVLIVEDDLIVRMVAVEYAAEAGWIILEAADADEAVRVLRENDDIAGLVTDVLMPGSMNGLELARRVRQRRPDVAVVVTSGYLNPNSHVLPEGVTFLRKPDRPEDLVRALERKE
jgi:CheY-like chemotaxis protein